VVSDGTVVWVYGDAQTSTVIALDLATAASAGVRRYGRRARQRAGRRQRTGVRGPTPTTFDLATGAQRWQMTLDGTPFAGPALDPNGSALYVGMCARR